MTDRETDVLALLRAAIDARREVRIHQRDRHADVAPPIDAVPLRVESGRPTRVVVIDSAGRTFALELARIERIEFRARVVG